MNVLVKSDVIWIRPVPRETVKDGIQLFIPKSISETRNGYTTYDVIKGQETISYLNHILLMTLLILRFVQG